MSNQVTGATTRQKTLRKNRKAMNEALKNLHSSALPKNSCMEPSSSQPSLSSKRFKDLNIDVQELHGHSISAAGQASEIKREFDSICGLLTKDDVENQKEWMNTRIECVSSSLGKNIEDGYIEEENEKGNSESIFNEEESLEIREQNPYSCRSSAVLTKNSLGSTSSTNLEADLPRNRLQTRPNCPRYPEERRSSEILTTEGVKIEAVSPQCSFLDIENLFNSPLSSFPSSSPSLNAASHPTVMFHPGAFELLAQNIQNEDKQDDDENSRDPFIGKVFYHTHARKTQLNDGIKEFNPSTQLSSKPSSDAHTSEKPSGSSMCAKDFLLEEATEALPESITTCSEPPVNLHLHTNKSSSLEKSGDSSSTSDVTNLRVRGVKLESTERNGGDREDVHEAEDLNLEANRTIDNCLPKPELDTHQIQSLPSCLPIIEQVSLAKSKQNRPRQRKRSQNNKTAPKANQKVVPKTSKTEAKTEKHCINFDGSSSINCPDSSEIYAAGDGKKKKKNIDPRSQHEKKRRNKAVPKNTNDRVSSNQGVNEPRMKVSHSVEAIPLGGIDTKQHEDSTTDFNDKLSNTPQFQAPEDKTKHCEPEEHFCASRAVSKRSAPENLPKNSSDVQYLASNHCLRGEIKSTKSSEEEPRNKNFSEAIDQVIPRETAEPRLKKAVEQAQVREDRNVIESYSLNENSGKKSPSPSDTQSNNADLYHDPRLENFSSNQNQVCAENKTTAAVSPSSKGSGKKRNVSKSTNISAECTKQKKSKKVQSSNTKGCAKEMPKSSSVDMTYEDHGTSTKRKRYPKVKLSKAKKSKIIEGTDSEIKDFDDQNKKDSAERSPKGKTIYETKNDTAHQHVNQAKTVLQTKIEVDISAFSAISPRTPFPSQQKRSRAPKKSSSKNIKSVASLNSAVMDTPEETRNLDLLVSPDNNIDQIQTEPCNSKCSEQQSVQNTDPPVYMDGGKINKISGKSTTDVESNYILTSSPAYNQSFSFFSGPSTTVAARRNNSNDNATPLKSSTESLSLFGMCKSHRSQPNVRTHTGESTLYKGKRTKQVQKQNLSFQDHQTQRSENENSSFTEFRSVPVDLVSTSRILQLKNKLFEKETSSYVPPDNLSIASMHINDYNVENDTSHPSEGLSITSSSRKCSKILHAPSLNIVKFPGVLTSLKTVNDHTRENNRVSCSFDSTKKTSNGNFEFSEESSEEKTETELDKITTKANKDFGAEWKARTSCSSDKSRTISLTSQTGMRSSSSSFQNQVARIKMPFATCETEHSDIGNTNAKSTATSNNVVNDESHQQSSSTLGQADSQDEIVKIDEREYRVLPAKLLLPIYNPLQFLSKIPPQPLILTLKQAHRKQESANNFDINDYDTHQMGC